MPSAEEDRVLALLRDDSLEGEPLLDRLDARSRATGVPACATLLKVLTGVTLEEGEARRRLEKIQEHRRGLARTFGRDLGLVVAALDYLTNVERHLVQPVIVDLEAFDPSSGGHADPVTGLASDRLLRASLLQEIERARRSGRPTCLVLFDLDGFADVDRRVGRSGADRVLREAGRILRERVRDVDLAARPGEDELALLLPGTDRKGGMLAAERFRSDLERHFSTAANPGASGAAGLTVSAGVASAPEDARSAEDLLECAARALYRAKAGGGNAVEAFAPERRKFLRWPVPADRLRVELVRIAAPARGRGEPGQADATAEAGGHGSVRNASRAGLLFAWPDPLQVGEEIELRILDPASDSSGGALTQRGRVVRVEEAGAGGYDIGVDLSPGDLGEGWLDRLDRRPAQGGGA